MFLCLFMWQRAGFHHLCIFLVPSCVLTATGGIFPFVVTSDPHGPFVKGSQFTSPRRDRLTLAQGGNYPSWDAIRQGTLSLSQLHHANRRYFFSFSQVSRPFPCIPSIVHSHQFQQLPFIFCPPFAHSFKNLSSHSVWNLFRLPRSAPDFFWMAVFSRMGMWSQVTIFPETHI